MNRINVLHVVQHSTGGGVIKQLFSLLRSYDKKTIRPMVCSLGGKGVTGELIEQSGIDFVALRFSRNDRLIPGAVRQLFRLMRDRQIHVVRTHGYGANLNGRIAAVLCRVPCVPSVHNVYTKEKKIHRRIANKLLSRISDEVIAVSEAVKDDIVRYDRIAPSKVLVIRNGVDTGLFSPQRTAGDIRKELGLGDNDTVIGFVGRLVPAKGLSYLIEAFADIRKENDRVKLLIVGRGFLLSSLQKMVSEKGLQGDILFAGERSDIADVLLSLDVFVMPSKWEGLPNALLEAMAMARPVLVTSAGGMGEIVKNGVHGLVVPVGDSGELSRGLKRLIEDRQLADRLGSAARTRIESSFSIQATARTWENLYKELLKKNGSGRRNVVLGGENNAE